jgi:hypothetical protein
MSRWDWHVNHFGVATNSSRIDAKRGDNFLQGRLERSQVTRTDQCNRDISTVIELNVRDPDDQLLLHAESEACSRADFLHVDFLDADALEAGAFKRPETDASSIIEVARAGRMR